jgi:hypothetical protein
MNGGDGNDDVDEDEDEFDSGQGRLQGDHRADKGSESGSFSTWRSVDGLEARSREAEQLQPGAPKDSSVTFAQHMAFHRVCFDRLVYSQTQGQRPPPEPLRRQKCG